ncbi:MAG: hypothetical protein N2235_07315 [Fischerella sp.]|nr:hypothetical protein [Fischerella sp.]
MDPSPTPPTLSSPSTSFISTTSSISPTSPTLPLSPSPHPPLWPSPTPNMEFSSGTSFTGNSTVFNLAAICLRDCAICRTKEESRPKRAIDPRSRVLLR